MLTDVFETLIVMEEGYKMHHVICLYYIMLRRLRCSFPLFYFFFLPYFLAFLSVLLCLKAEANFASFDLIIYVVAFVAPQFMASCFCQLSSKQM